jgi:hypothetical protein
VVVWGLALLAAAVVALIVLIRPPSWWDPIVPGDAAAADRAEAFEQGCVGEIHRVRESADPWAIRIREADVNAWLGARLGKWCRHVGVPEIGPAQVRFGEGTIEVALEAPGLPSVAVARFAPRVEVESERLLAGLEGMALGRLPLTALTRSAFAAVAQSLLGAEGEIGTAARLLSDESIDPTFELADGRMLRIRDLEVRDGELVVEFVKAERGR